MELSGSASNVLESTAKLIHENMPEISLDVIYSEVQAFMAAIGGPLKYVRYYKNAYQVRSGLLIV